MSWTCDRKLWKTPKGLIVEDGDPRAWSLVATPGMVLDEKPKIEPLPGSKAIKPAEDKAEEPAEDKAVKPAENKAGKPKSRGK